MILLRYQLRSLRPFSDRASSSFYFSSPCANPSGAAGAVSAQVTLMRGVRLGETSGQTLRACAAIPVQRERRPVYVGGTGAPVALERELPDRVGSLQRRCGMSPGSHGPCTTAAACPAPIARAPAPGN